jgi:hypothetical protein
MTSGNFFRISWIGIRGFNAAALADAVVCAVLIGAGICVALDALLHIQPQGRDDSMDEPPW